jgi:hypothetical protein
MNGRSTGAVYAAIASATVIVTCFAVIIASGSGHPGTASVAAVIGLIAITVFLAAWPRVFGRQR